MEQSIETSWMIIFSQVFDMLFLPLQEVTTGSAFVFYPRSPPSLPLPPSPHSPTHPLHGPLCTYWRVIIFTVLIEINIYILLIFF